jgi:tRNA pseudouridine38-40 synthase
MTRNIKLTIAYDGGDFHGWQVQPGQQTVQGVLMDLLYRITGEMPALCGAGRTDAGVHAWGQVAHFKTESAINPHQLAGALNALAPPSIRIREAAEVPVDFHARWLASAKTYQYRIYRGAVVPPFYWRYVLHDPRPLDFAAMAEAARYFEGEHDFSSFAASTGSIEEDRERIMTRRIALSEMVRCETPFATRIASMTPTASTPFPGEQAGTAEEWVYAVRGRSFLRNMVRKIVGTLLEIGRGRMGPQDIAELFDARDRTRSGPVAPPQGLCLMSVEYSSMEYLGECAGQNREVSHDDLEDGTEDPDG